MVALLRFGSLGVSTGFAPESQAAGSDAAPGGGLEDRSLEGQPARPQRSRRAARDGVLELRILRAVEHEVRVSRPDSDLLVLGILDDAELVHRREDGHADRLVGRVPDLVRALGPGRESDDITCVERFFAFACAYGRPAVERDP